MSQSVCVKDRRRRTFGDAFLLNAENVRGILVTYIAGIMFACSRGSFVVVLFEHILLSSHVLLCCIEFEGTTAMRFQFV